MEKRLDLVKAVQTILLENPSVCIRCQHLTDDNVMVTSFDILYHAALNVRNTLFDDRWSNELCLDWSKPSFNKFVHISTGATTAKERLTDDVIWSDIDHKLARFANKSV